MKLLLMQPPIQDFYDTDIRLQPLGLCMLKAAVKKHLPEVEVVVKDYHQGLGRRTVSLPEELAYLKAYYPYPDSSPFSSFHNYFHFGASYREIEEDAAKEKPDLVGVSSLFSPYNREALSCARAVKRRTGAPVLMGGSHVSAAPASVLSDPDVDFVIRGEGERPLVEFLKAFLSDKVYQKVPNLGFKENGNLVLNPMGENFPLDALPFADLSDLPKDRYLYRRKPLCFLTTSRGCPHRCSFCSVHLTFGETFRKRTPENVLAEIRTRYEEGYRVFDFEDDNLTFYQADFKRLLRALSEAFDPDEVLFVAMNGISYMSLDEETLRLMKAAGFRDLNLSLVSADAKVLRRANRPHTVEKYLKVVKQAFALGFNVVSYQILGLPYESLEDMVGTLSLMAALPVLIGASLFYLTPGCPVASEFPEMTESDIFKSRSTAMAVETDRFTRDDLYTLFVTARIINFLKGLKLEKGAATIREILEIKGNLGKREEIGLELLVRLFEEDRLYAAARQEFMELPRFKADIFRRVLRRTECIRTQKGAAIYL